MAAPSGRPFPTASVLAHLMAVQEIAWSMLSGNGNDCSTTACCLVALTALLPPAA
jgi:hypothetical protein